MSLASLMLLYNIQSICIFICPIRGGGLAAIALQMP